MNEKIFRFHQSLQNAIHIAINLTDEYRNSFISNEVFIASLFCEPNSSLYQIAIANGFDHEKILNIIYETILKKEVQYCIVPTTFKLDLSGEITVTCQYDIRSILEAAGTVAKDYGRTEITVDDAIVAFAHLSADVYVDIVTALIHGPALEDINLYLLNVTNYGAKKQSNLSLPESVSDFLSVVNDLYSPTEKICPIGGREKEVSKIEEILTKHTKRNCILIGDAGVGKTAIIEKFTWQIVTGHCPDMFKESIVVSLDVNALISGTTLRGMAEQRFMDLILFLEKNPNVILFIDEVHQLIGAGAGYNNNNDLANVMKPILARSKARVIGATTPEEYINFLEDCALERRFEPIYVYEPKFQEIYPMIKNKLDILQQAHGTKISRRLIDDSIIYAACFTAPSKNPDKTLDLIDQAMARAKLDGRSIVKKRDILQTFDVYTEKFKNMSTSLKMQVAYHEAGHYLVEKFSQNLSNSTPLAVSIMPAQDYLGVTVVDYDFDLTPNYNIDYYIASIGTYLAGRIAESMYSGEVTAGACSDLENATILAKKIITKWAMTTELGNRVFDEKTDLIPENASKINTLINKFLKKAEIYARSILTENKAYLDLLAKELTKKGIMTEKEIKRLFAQIECD